MRQPIKERFDAKWIPEPNSGCWLWTDYTADGYGIFNSRHPDFPTNKAHRVSWLLYRGPIPTRLVLDHICRVRCCVNPEHLRAVTLKQNSVQNSFGGGAVNARKMYCVWGHPFAGDNLRLQRGKDGTIRRCCRACQQRSYRIWLQKKLGRPLKRIGIGARKGCKPINPNASVFVARVLK